jgi:hypothetical protein
MTQQKHTGAKFIYGCGSCPKTFKTFAEYSKHHKEEHEP